MADYFAYFTLFIVTAVMIGMAIDFKIDFKKN